MHLGAHIPRDIVFVLTIAEVDRAPVLELQPLLVHIISIEVLPIRKFLRNLLHKGTDVIIDEFFVGTPEEVGL